uniref:Uncharacterized protein n=1 Tax=Eptatretus burgeri TaxID=7764 RepID=A0A8C4Q7D4_EPTBU
MPYHLSSLRSARSSPLHSADLDKITSWSNMWNMSFNPDKSHTLGMSLRNENHPIYFLNNPLEEVLSFELLGLTISNDLSWESHISNLASKASCRLSILHRAESFLGTPEFLTTYKAFVCSLMEYCSPLWGGAPASHLSRFHTVETKAFRVIGISRYEAESLCLSLSPQTGLVVCLSSTRITAHLHSFIPLFSPPSEQTSTLSSIPLFPQGLQSSCSLSLIFPHTKQRPFLPPLIHPKPSFFKFPASLPESPCIVHLVYPVYPAPSLS